MTALFKKLNYKNQTVIFCLNAPSSFDNELVNMQKSTTISRSIEAETKIHFLLAFVLKKEEIDNTLKKIAQKLEGDATIWFCYPKGTSKKYSCDFSRDTGWDGMEQKGLHGVRMVSIDEDWSAFRFRKREFIKKMTRKNG